MARIQTVVTTMTCDMCGNDAEATDTFTVAVDEGTRQRSLPRTVDLCGDHATQLRELTATVRRKGVTVPATDTQPQLPLTTSMVTCPVCGKDVTRNNLISHIVNTHNVPRVLQPPTCPDCGKAVDNTNGMVLHRKMIHDYDSLAEYVAAAAKPPKRKGR